MLIDVKSHWCNSLWGGEGKGLKCLSNNFLPNIVYNNISLNTS